MFLDLNLITIFLLNYCIFYFCKGLVDYAIFSKMEEIPFKESIINNCIRAYILFHGIFKVITILITIFVVILNLLNLIGTIKIPFTELNRLNSITTFVLLFNSFVLFDIFKKKKSLLSWTIEYKN
jgi:uncharacterized membrane protein (Fun14 family)